MGLPKSFLANGKLLLSSEYFILDGAKGLALPTKFNQTLQLIPTTTNLLEWKSYDEHQQVWFECAINSNFELLHFSEKEIATMLLKILKEAFALNKSMQWTNYLATTNLNFNRQFGLGTSSTLISLMAQWFQINPYQLLEKTFGGSGYDIACASANQPIVFFRDNNHQPHFELVILSPKITEHLYFVYLNKKQNSREGINYYRQLDISSKNEIIEQLNRLTNQFITCTSIDEFMKLMEVHETIIADALQLKKIKNTLFDDFDGAVKSLGAWGGDFVLVATSREIEYVKKYFNTKQYNKIISYNDIVQD